jgi:hypothetical protein
VVVIVGLSGSCINFETDEALRLRRLQICTANRLTCDSDWYVLDAGSFCLRDGFRVSDQAVDCPRCCSGGCSFIGATRIAECSASTPGAGGGAAGGSPGGGAAGGGLSAVDAGVGAAGGSPGGGPAGGGGSQRPPLRPWNTGITVGVEPFIFLDERIITPIVSPLVPQRSPLPGEAAAVVITSAGPVSQPTNLRVRRFSPTMGDAGVRDLGSDGGWRPVLAAGNGSYAVVLRDITSLPGSGTQTRRFWVFEANGSERHSGVLQEPFGLDLIVALPDGWWLMTAGMSTLSFAPLGHDAGVVSVPCVTGGLSAVAVEDPSLWLTRGATILGTPNSGVCLGASNPSGQAVMFTFDGRQVARWPLWASFNARTAGAVAMSPNSFVGVGLAGRGLTLARANIGDAGFLTGESQVVASPDSAGTPEPRIAWVGRLGDAGVVIVGQSTSTPLPIANWEPLPITSVPTTAPGLFMVRTNDQLAPVTGLFFQPPFSSVDDLSAANLASTMDGIIMAANCQGSCLDAGAAVLVRATIPP